MLAFEIEGVCPVLGCLDVEMIACLQMSCSIGVLSDGKLCGMIVLGSTSDESRICDGYIPSQ